MSQNYSVQIQIAVPLSIEVSEQIPHQSSCLPADSSPCSSQIFIVNASQGLN